MAKPKGGTLTRLFEVSERERQEFYQNIQKKIQPVDQAPEQEFGIPAKGIPETGTPEIGIPEKGIPTQKLRIRRALHVQDGHSLGEQLVLTALWNEADVVEDQPYRRIAIGYRTLSAICGLTVNNCKANLKSLQAKLAIESEAGYSNTLATTYRVFSFAEILRRREFVGLTHVLRTKGTLFVDPVTGIPVTGTPPVPVPGIPDIWGGVPVPGEKGIPVSGTQLRIKKEGVPKENPALVVVVSSSIRKHISIDDAAVRQIVDSCREQDPGASAEEIAHFSEVKILQHRQNPSIQNLPGLLIRSVRDYFRPPAGELTDYRAAKERERQRGREVAQQIIDNPESSEEERKWAREILG